MGTPSGVVITGATGLVGTALAASCASDGMKICALVRNTAQAVVKLPSATLHAWDATKAPPPEGAFEDVDAVVNLVGEPIGVGRWSEDRKKRLRDSRVVGTRALVDALRGLSRRPAVLVSASGTGYYGDQGDKILTETSEPGQGFLAELARDWEAEALKARELGMRVVLLRSGVVLSREAGILRKILPMFRLGMGGRLGTGAQWFPWIHIDDEIGLIRHALAGDAVTGPLNAVAPEPITNAEFTRTLGEVLGRPTVVRAPAFALRFALREMADSVLLASQRAMPVRTLEVGYAFRHPLLRAALEDLVGRRSHQQAASSATAG